MLSQPLARRIVRHQTCCPHHELHRNNTVRATITPIWQQQRAQRRTAQTAATKKPASTPRSKVATPSARQLPSVVPRSLPPKASRPRTPPPPTAFTGMRPRPAISTDDDLKTIKQSPDAKLTALPFTPYEPRSQSSADLRESQDAKAQDGFAKLVLGDGHKEVRLFQATPHAWLLAVSTMGGVAFSSYCVQATVAFVTATSDTWLIMKAATILGGAVGTVMGVALLATTLKQIHTISLVQTAKGYRLRFETKFNSMYFWQTKQIDVPLVEKSIKTNQDLDSVLNVYYPIPFERRHEWTDLVKAPTLWQRITDPKALRLDIRADVAKAFVRGGMSYIELEGSLWKIDFNKATIVDQGHPLERYFKVDKSLRANTLSLPKWGR